MTSQHMTMMSRSMTFPQFADVSRPAVTDNHGHRLWRQRLGRTRPVLQRELPS